MKFDAPAVGHGCLEVHVVVRPTTAIGDRQIKSLSQSRYFYGFGVATDGADIWLRDIDGMIGDQFAMAKAMALVLAGGKGNRRVSSQVGEERRVILIDRLFEPGNAVRS